MIEFEPSMRDHEVILDSRKVIMSKTNHKGIIEFCNEYFINISGFSEEELIGKAHNIIRHPDMPKVIFKIMWEKLHKGESLYAIVKNLTKDGRYYWVVTKFETTFDDDGKIISHYARRKAIPQKVKETVAPIYKIIIDIEKHDTKLAEETFFGILKDFNLTYDELFLEMSGMSKQEVDNYFLSKNMNINTQSENILSEIDGNDAIDNTENIKDIINDLQQEIQSFKKEKTNTNTQTTKINSGFLGDFPELNELKSLLKNKA